MLGDPPKPKPKGKFCQRCHGWYRPSKFRSAGAMLEFCSVKCKKKAMQETEVKTIINREW